MFQELRSNRGQWQGRPLSSCLWGSEEGPAWIDQPTWWTPHARAHRRRLRIKPLSPAWLSSALWLRLRPGHQLVYDSVLTGAGPQTLWGVPGPLQVT